MYVVDWLAFRANCVFTYVLSGVGDTRLSTSVFVSVVDWLALSPTAVSTSVLVYVVDWLAFKASCVSTYFLSDFGSY